MTFIASGGIKECRSWIAVEDVAAVAEEGEVDEDESDLSDYSRGVSPAQNTA